MHFFLTMDKMTLENSWLVVRYARNGFTKDARAYQRKCLKMKKNTRNGNVMIANEKINTAIDYGMDI